MNDVDKLTLELFTSKNTYRRYLAKTDPEMFQKQERLQEKICEHKVEILERFEEMLSASSSSGPSNSSFGPSAPSCPSGELTECFERFLSVLLQEIESAKLREMRSESPFLLEDYENGNKTREEEEEEQEDDAMLFSNSSSQKTEEKKSFWSKDRVIKRETYSEAILSHYPTNSEIRKRYVGKRMMP
jgi:hypothetical protein